MSKKIYARSVGIYLEPYIDSWPQRNMKNLPFQESKTHSNANSAIVRELLQTLMEITADVHTSNE